MNGMDPNAGLLFRSIPSILTIQGWNLRRGLFLLGALLGLARATRPTAPLASRPRDMVPGSGTLN